jgi:hypothetical protein
MVPPVHYVVSATIHRGAHHEDHRHDSDHRRVTLTSIDTASLDDVTGGCGACGQTCANGPASAAAGGSKLPGVFAAVNAFSRR